MEIKEANEVFTMVLKQGRNREYRRMLMSRTAIVKPIQVMALHVHSIGAVKDSIWVDHRNNDEDKGLSQELGLC